MRILVEDVEIAQSVHAQKRILLDTMILCYAHDRLSPDHAKASLIIEAAVKGLIETCISYQNLAEFYSVVTSKRVKRSMIPREASSLCVLYERSVAIRKLLPTTTAYDEALESAKNLSLVGGLIFDCILAHTAKNHVDTLWTENTQHFKEYVFLNAENPLKWEWEKKQ